ncbi:hypothetical protein DTO271G3_5028 [Paecilomyces variotii]|nr:hypothetical protein DTO271G3_5028 [Paecilomyces variotii]
MAPTLLTPRADTSSCPSTISGGGIAGIVIGSIAGTLLIIWIIRLCSTPGAFSGGDPDWGYRSGATDSRGRHRRRRSDSYVIEKSPSRSRRYRDDVRRPAKVYMSS